MAKKTTLLKIKRADGPKEPFRWEEFEVVRAARMNVVGALMAIRKNPVTRSGAKVAPVVWECSCLEEVCGACTMLVNGRVRQACSALVDELSPNGEPLVLEPMTKFPLVRDLMVDRSRMLGDLGKVKAWLELDGSHELGAGPRQSQHDQEEAYPLSRCITCGCCLEACPQTNDSSGFIGAAAINEVRLLNLHPTGRMHAAERLETLMDDGGIAGCGKAQNCVVVCPKGIPLVDSIATVARQMTSHLLFGRLLK